MTNEYHFITHWRVEGTAAEVYGIISTPADYPRWWPSVYIEAAEIASGDADGLGRRVRFLTRGWLPYTLRWESCAVAKQPPHRLEVRATGDFDGRGMWMLEQQSGAVQVIFDWKLTADKPLLRYLSFLLKPAFAANHRWAMARGEESLTLELARRHAAIPDRLRRGPAPPGPARWSGFWLAAGGAVVLAALAGVWRILR